MNRSILSAAVASALLLTGCGDNDKTNIIYGLNSGQDAVVFPTTVESISSFNTFQIDAVPGLDDATPDARCDLNIEKVTYQTKGAAGEVTNATAALMLPSGSNVECQGDRPVLLYAHGTTTDKNYDFSQVGNAQNSAASEATLIAANFAAQGYIVVAPNYAGYDDSELDYHPYLVAEQQSADMVDALDSARAIIDEQQLVNNPNYNRIDDSGKLYISGYSQGGYVAMATARLLQEQNRPIEAIAPLSGPYALAAFGDAIFLGNVNVGATRFAPLLATGLQKKYPGIYNNTSEIFTSRYANTQLPSMLSFAELVQSNQLPDNALFETKPTGNPTLDNLPASELPFAVAGFDNEDYLIRSDFRAQYVTDALQNPDGLVPTLTTGLPATSPQNNLRKALKDNDLRGYLPTMPTLLCGGNQDPTVFYDLNTRSVAGILQQVSIQNPQANLNITVLDVDATNANSRPDNQAFSLIGQASMNNWQANAVVADVQTRFANNVQQVISGAIQQGVNPGVAVLARYHGGLVSTACTQATREFFAQSFDR